MKADIDWSNVKKLAQDIIDSEEPDDDDNQYVYEEVMIAVFGGDIFKYLNKKWWG